MSNIFTNSKGENWPEFIDRLERKFNIPIGSILAKFYQNNKGGRDMQTQSAMMIVKRYEKDWPKIIRPPRNAKVLYRGKRVSWKMFAEHAQNKKKIKLTDKLIFKAPYKTELFVQSWAINISDALDYQFSIYDKRDKVFRWAPSPRHVDWNQVSFMKRMAGLKTNSSEVVLSIIKSWQTTETGKVNITLASAFRIIEEMRNPNDWQIPCIIKASIPHSDLIFNPDFILAQWGLNESEVTRIVNTPIEVEYIVDGSILNLLQWVKIIRDFYVNHKKIIESLYESGDIEQWDYMADILTKHANSPIITKDYLKWVKV